MPPRDSRAMLHCQRLDRLRTGRLRVRRRPSGLPRSQDGSAASRAAGTRDVRSPGRHPSGREAPRPRRRRERSLAIALLADRVCGRQLRLHSASLCQPIEKFFHGRPGRQYPDGGSRYVVVRVTPAKAYAPCKKRRLRLINRGAFRCMTCRPGPILCFMILD